MPLRADDLVELPPDIGQHVPELVPVEQLLALLAKPFDEVLEAAHVLAGWVA